MSSKEFTVAVDGRKVLIDQASQEISILDSQGAIVFRDRIQVAAGSVQGIFSAAEQVADLTRNINPARRA